MKNQKMERDYEIVLSLISQYSGKITWYPLARKTKLNITAVLKNLSEKGYITSFFVKNQSNEREYFSITELGEKYLEYSEKFDESTWLFD